jgi:iron complex outermembrane receptor protein
MKQFIISMILLTGISTNSAFSQTGTLHVTITDYEKKPLQYVNVILSTGEGKVTNKLGEYSIENVNPGVCTIRISSMGYETETKQVSIIPSQTLQVNFQLKEQVLELQSVEIIGSRATTYDNKTSFAATKVATLVKDIPQAISYITKEVMSDRLSYRINDVVKNISSVNQFSFYNDYTIRGFRSQQETINGLRVVGLFGPQILTPTLERVEVIKGPASAILGNGNPGGTMNRVTKNPLTTEKKAISFTTGSFNIFRSTLDFTGPLNESKTLLYRLNVAYENSDDFRDLQEFKSIVIAPSVSFIPSSKTRLNFDLVLQKFDGKLDSGQPIFGASSGTNLNSTPISFAIGQTNDYQRSDANFATISLSHKFSENITFNTSYMKYLFDEDLIEHRTSNAFAINGSGMPIPTLMNMQVLNRQREFISDNVSSYFTLKANSGSLEHSILVGMITSLKNNQSEPPQAWLGVTC